MAFTGLLVLIATAALLTACQGGEPNYIASDQPTVQAYVADETGTLQETEPLVRGTECMARSDTIDGYMAVDIGDETYYVSPTNLAPSEEESVQEQQLFVRTPATIYKDTNSPQIAGFAPKGSELQVTGHTKVRGDGTVKLYQVKYGDTTGYVYGKYLTGDEASAKKNCNKNGAYDMAKDATFSTDLHGGEATGLDYYPCPFTPIKGNEFCDKARGIYLHAGAAVSDKYFELAKSSGANVAVINIDGGTLAYRSPVAEKLCPSAYKDAQHSVEDYQKAVQRYKDAGFYTIGRIVAFNDEHFAADHEDACILSGGKKTKWVSAYSRSAWEYKVSVAIEAVETMGFNEIQFDYVRFPEGSYEMSISGDTDFRNQYDETKAQAIQNFCLYAADQIHEAGAYVSIDVFGECSNGYVTAYGQYWPAISNVVDAISAMPYTDHFGEEDTWTEPYSCLNQWAKRSADMQAHIPTPAVARTWITGYNTPHWNPTVSYDYEKLHDQVRALEDAGLDGGFIPWNSKCEFRKYEQYIRIWSE